MQAQLRSVRTSSPVNWGKINRRHAPLLWEQSYPAHPLFWNTGSLRSACPFLCATVPGHTLTNSLTGMNSGIGDRGLSLFISCASNFILLFLALHCPLTPIRIQSTAQCTGPLAPLWNCITVQRFQIKDCMAMPAHVPHTCHCKTCILWGLHCWTRTQTHCTATPTEWGM